MNTNELMKANSLYPLLFLMTALFGLMGCAGSSEFKGPGFQQETKTVISNNDTVTVGLTHAVLGKDFFNNLTFWRHTLKVAASLEDNPGFVGRQLRGDFWIGEAWTVTVWEDENSLNNFIKSAAHQTAMQKGWSALDTAEFVRITISRSELPLSWNRAENLIKEHGRKIKANTQSAASYDNNQ